jgi:predicted nucleic acid-binding protein
MAPIQSIYLDTNVIIAMVEGPDAASQTLDNFVRGAVAAHKATFHISALCMAELLVLPYRNGNRALAEDYLGLAARITGLETHPVSDAILDVAAVLRANINRLKLPDAIHLATASMARCDCFLTFDKGLSDVAAISHPVFTDQTIAPVTVIRPDPDALAALAKAFS